MGTLGIIFAILAMGASYRYDVQAPDYIDAFAIFAFTLAALAFGLVGVWA